MKKMMLIFSIFAFVSGCSFFEEMNKSLTIEQKSLLIRNASRTATYLTLKEIYKDDHEKMLIKAAMIRDHLEIEIPPPITLEKIKMALVAHIPGDYKLLMQSALDVFDLYFVVPEDAVLNPDNLPPGGIILIDAFVRGIVEGADLVITNG